MLCRYEICIHNHHTENDEDHQRPREVPDDVEDGSEGCACHPERLQRDGGGAAHIGTDLAFTHLDAQPDRVVLVVAPGQRVRPIPLLGVDLP